MIPLWTTLLLGAILYYFISSFLARRKLPPGPTPWPLIGNLGKELKPPYIIRDLEELAKKFGGICTVHMPFPVVNITDYEILKEALNGDDLSGRFQNSVTDIVSNGVPNGGIVTSDGNSWRIQRRLAISILRDLGMGRNLMEEKIQLALREYISFIKILVANIINEFIFGFRYTYKTADPLITYLHEADAALREFGQETQLVACCSDLFIAGQETSITTFKWGIIFMAAYPKVQERIRAEIRAVTANARMPSFSDKNKMPFTVASLHEIQRCGNILAITAILMHRAERDVVINGHRFPKDTIFNTDYHHVMAHDPHFKEPEKFNPDRYLMEDGVTLKKELVDRTVPFGMGKRQCAGEGLARMELFLGLTTTVQNFRILPPIGGCVDTEPLYTGTVHFSKPHNLQLVHIKLDY